ncbi:MAG TPA: hypothetical protein VFW65_35120 [Pseudonocardiaceae bacterium]|nr:hypothetical protein [Pseudonocardiaceae bacterium]
MSSASPPVDFPLYGLDRWGGPRWLETYDGQLGKPTWGVRLGHQRGTDTYVGVATLPRERFDRLCGADRREVAMFGTFWLINLTLPDGRLPRPDGFVRDLVDLSRNAAGRHAHWPRVRWSIGEAAIWRFAGGWTGFAVLADVYVVVAAFGVQPAGLGFAVVSDGTPYGFDLAGRLRTTDLPAARERTGPAEPALLNNDAWHADHAALLDEQAD